MKQITSHSKGKNIEMRNPDVTCTKAVGIMLMVLCHAGIGCQGVVAFVYMFHMPLFFFLSGYCLKEKHFAQPHVFAWRRVKGVWWPYAKWSLVFLALHNLFFALNIYNGEYGWQGNGSHLYGWGEIVERAGGILLLMHKHEQLLGGYWFMRTLLRGSLIAFALLWLVHITNRKTKLHTAYGLIVGGGVFCLHSAYYSTMPTAR